MISAGIAYTVDSQTSVTAATVTGSGVVISPSLGDVLIFRLDWTCNSGTPTLDVKIQHAPSSSGTFTDLLSFTQATTGTGTYEVQLPVASMAVLPVVRAVGTLGGTSPNYTYTVKAFTN